MKASIAILFASRDSIYKTIPGLDVYDERRDARRFKARLPVVAHPPCRLWSQLRHMSTAPVAERQLAIFALLKVQQNGGVLEHPASSCLWPFLGLPEPSESPDYWGGWTMAVPQFWFGHRANKSTRLYIVGVRPANVPIFDLRLGEPEFICCGSRSKRSEISKHERSATPRKFADFLLAIAGRVHRPPQNTLKSDGREGPGTKKTF